MKNVLLFIGITLLFLPSFGQEHDYVRKKERKTSQTEISNGKNASQGDDLLDRLRTEYKEKEMMTLGSGSPAQMMMTGADACSGAVSLTPDGTQVCGSTAGSSTEPGEDVNCGGTADQSVWYSFTATDTDHYVSLEMSSKCYGGSAVYTSSGGCPYTTSLSCEDAAGGPDPNIHSLSGLTVGQTYYLQIFYSSGGPCGSGLDYCVTVDVPVTCSSCNTTCGGACGFATTPTVQTVVDNCPANVLVPPLQDGDFGTYCYDLTTVSSTLDFNVIITGTGCTTGNVYSLAWDLYNSNCGGGSIDSGDLTDLTASGLTVGESYVFCYTIEASCTHTFHRPFWVGAAPLSIDDFNFDLKAVGNGVEVTWTEKELEDVDYFVLMRSSDGKQFEKVETIKSNESGKYSFLDKSVYEDKYYYRFDVVYADNSADKSQVKSIEIPSSFVYYVHGNDLVTLFDKDQEVTYQILTTSGRVIQEGVVEDNLIELDQNEKGVFIVRFENVDFTRVGKFVIQ